LAPEERNSRGKKKKKPDPKARNKCIAPEKKMLRSSKGRKKGPNREKGKGGEEKRVCGPTNSGKSP